MKDKKILATIVGIVVVVAIAVTTVIIVNNNNNAPETGNPDSSKTDPNTSNPDKNSKPDGSGAIYSENGVDIKSVAIELVGDTPNFMVIFANNNSEDVDFDCSQFKLSFSDGSSVQPVTSVRTLGANKSYIQHAFTFTKEDLKVGDVINVYYGGNSLGAVEVTEF